MSTAAQRGLFNAAPPIRITELFDQAPPYSPEAEMALIGAMIVDNDVVDEVTKHVSDASVFFVEAHGLIYDALVAAMRHSRSDLILLIETLRDRGHLDRIGGTAYLEKLMKETPGPAAGEHYARVVADKARTRKLIEASGKILYAAYNTGAATPGASESLLEQAEQLIFDINRRVNSNERATLEELLAREVERMEAKDRHQELGLATGFEGLDQLIGGFIPGDMIVIAARPSVGKTALMMNIVEQIARGGVAPGRIQRPKSDWVKVGVFSLEMSKSAITQRMVCAAARVTMPQLRGHTATSPAELMRMSTAMTELSELQIFIDDTAGLTIGGLRSRARRMVMRDGVQAIFVDYLQLMTAPEVRGENRQVEVSAISRGIKAMARELNVPVVALCQLNRGSEDRRDNRPRLSDLRESGAIEQDADLVILLHREAAHHVGDRDWAEANPHKVNAAELIVAKQRNGPVDSVSVLWDSAVMRFVGKDDPAAPAVAPVRPAKPEADQAFPITTAATELPL